MILKHLQTCCKRLSFLQQDHFKYDEFTVLNTVLMGHKPLWDNMQEREALYSKPEMTEADGNRAAELEEQFAEMDGWDFDRQVRSLLEDAEVKAPGRVWRSVAGRLDAAGAAPAAGGWWRWAGAGLAFAAALVAGVFVFRGPGMKPAEQNLIAVINEVNCLAVTCDCINISSCRKTRECCVAADCYKNKAVYIIVNKAAFECHLTITSCI